MIYKALCWMIDHLKADNHQITSHYLRIINIIQCSSREREIIFKYTTQNQVSANELH